VYKEALRFVQEKKPDIAKYFVSNIGFGIGLEFRDAYSLLKLESKVVAKENMTFNLAVGFQGIPKKNPTDATGDNYALLLADTLLIEAYCRDRCCCCCFFAEMG
jgi:nucleosome binding factor SPN SPT16 subunit